MSEKLPLLASNGLTCLNFASNSVFCNEYSVVIMTVVSKLNAILNARAAWMAVWTTNSALTGFINVFPTRSSHVFCIQLSASDEWFVLFNIA